MPHLNCRAIAIWCLCFAVAVTGLLSPPAAAQTGDDSAIRNLVEKFFAAYQKEDIEGLMSLWSEKSGDFASGRQSLEQTFAAYQNIEVKSFSLGKVTAAADRTKVQLVVELSALDAKTGKPADGLGKMHRIMEFVKEGGSWKLWRYVSSDEDLAAELIAARTDEERKALLTRSEQRVTSGLVRELNKKGNTLYTQSQYAQALAIYEIGLSVARRIDDKTVISLMLISVGNVNFNQGNFTKATELFQESLKLAEEAGSKVYMARALATLGSISFYQSNYPQALERYLRSVQLRDEVGDKGIGPTLGNIAGVYYSLGNYELALEYQQRALKLAEELGDPSAIATALTNMGALYLMQGDYFRSLEARQRSLKFSQAGGDKTVTAQALQSIGLTYYALGNYQQALEFYQQSLQLAQEIGNKPIISGMLGNIGTVHYAEGNYAHALEFMQKAMKLDEETGNKANLATALNTLGSIYNRQGNHTLALETFQQSQKLGEELGYAEVIGPSLTNIGNTYRYLGKYPEAVDYGGRAVAFSRRTDNTDVLWQALTVVGRANESLKQFDLARAAFVDAISLIEKLREQTVGGERGQQRFFEGRVSPYYGMVDLLVKQKDPAQALLYAERAKGRALLDVLSTGRVKITKAMTTEELARDRTLTVELSTLNTRISRLKSDPNSTELPALNARLEKARLEYESFQTNLYTAHPELKIQRGQANTLTLDEAAKLLPDDRTALLEYVVGEDNSYLFVITKAPAASQRDRAPVTLKVYTLNLKAKDMSEMCESFRRRVAERDLTVKTPARQIYELLIKPAETQLRRVNNLIIVPDGPLWDLPFQALYRGQAGYLLEHYAVSYAPSLSVLREMIRKGAELRSVGRDGRPVAVRERSPLPENFVPELLALGNPVLNRETVAKIGSVRGDETLTDLPDAEREVSTLGELYGPARSRVLIGNKATEEEVKAESGKYLLLHFATHAILDDRNPMYSRIVLSHAGDGKQEDGLLEAWELMNLDLTAEMAVLSACQTARGRVGAGEGMIGISWGLFVAGCPTVVVSQWKVDSSRTTDLMLEFHRNLLRRKRANGPGTTKAEALRQAALKLLRGQYNHPAYWAGFVLIGNER